MRSAVATSARVALRRINATLFRHGWIFSRHTYDVPIPVAKEIDSLLGQIDSAMVGIRVDERKAIDFLENVVANRLHEFRQVVRDESRAPRFTLFNGRFMAVDAHVYYALIRAYRPQRIIEIGAGQSTVVAVAAAPKTREKTRHAPSLLLTPTHRTISLTLRL